MSASWRRGRGRSGAPNWCWGFAALTEPSRRVRGSRWRSRALATSTSYWGKEPSPPVWKRLLVRGRQLMYIGRRKNAPLTYAKVRQKCDGACMYLERFLSHSCTIDLWPVRWARVHRKEIILNCWVEMAMECCVSSTRADWLISFCHSNFDDTLTEGSAFICQPHLPPHELSVWLPPSSVLTGRMNDDMRLIPGFTEMNAVCFVWLQQLASFVINEHASSGALSLNILFGIQQYFCLFVCLSCFACSVANDLASDANMAATFRARARVYVCVCFPCAES